VIRQIEAAGLAAALRPEGENGWVVRFGPVRREEMLAVLNGYVW
jgi:regulator of protease activity HflC (stomatin/prohibitin superfamily)